MCAFSHCESKEGAVIYAKMGILFSFISNIRGIIVISGSNFTDNLASSMGGVILAISINVMIHNHCRFTSNEAAQNGGVICINWGYNIIRLIDSIFSSCKAENNGRVLASMRVLS